uniref:Uncharacterized protein C6orf118 homolog isoform X2 n=1 Tax=Geotrypetes seraphini TaxID=260995 RepID=A0A6P8QVC3_GEOSA|nr:uncharacterized protein C6orf118 homolog isoform X2 [Geotrypetes seraphini]
MHESKNQKPVPLKVLLDGIEKANQEEIQTYTIGHLNCNNLYKPQVLIQKNFWRSNQELTRSRGKSHFSMPPKLEERVKLMKNSWADFTIKTSLISSSKNVTSQVLSKGESKMKKLRPVSPIQSQFTGFFQESGSEDKGQDAEEKTNEPVLKDELELPDLQLLKFKPVGGRRIGIMDSIAEYHFLPSYLAGLTKTEQFNMFKRFNKDYLKKEDLLEKEITRNKIAEDHEKKLMKELLKLGNINPLHFQRLKVFSDCFQDVCNNSVIFGDLLSQIKNAYELYLEVLLDSHPDTQCKTFLVQMRDVKNRAVKTCEVKEAIKEVKDLEDKAKFVLLNNERLRNELKNELLKRQSDVEEEGEYLPPEVKESTKKHVTSTLQEQYLFKKYQILALWDEIQELKQEYAENSAFTGDSEITEEGLRYSEDLDSKIQKALSKHKITKEIQQETKQFLKNFLSSGDGK